MIAFVYLNKDKNVSQGAGYVAAIAEQLQPVEFFDTAYMPLADVISQVSSSKYDLVAISASTVFIQDAYTLATAVKEKTGTLILIGGIHATVTKEQVLHECQAVDYICVGEGEWFIREFLTPGYDLHSIRGLGYRDSMGQPVVNEPQPVTDLKNLPPFPYEMFNAESIIQQTPLPGFCYVYATRGCPFKCTYCNNSSYLDMYGTQYLRAKDPDDVIKELLWLKSRHPVKLFYFGDEMFFANMEFAEEILSRVHDEVGLPYGCMARAEYINASSVNLLSETGCRYIGVGIECGNEGFRRAFLGRGMSNAQIVDAFSLIRTGIPEVFITAFNMTGYPVSYDATLTADTEALNGIIAPDITQTSVFYPFPGTKMHAYCTEYDLIDPLKLAQVKDVFSESVLR